MKTLIEQLQKGCIWRYDGEFPDIDEPKTDELMKEASDRIEELELAIRLARDKFFSDGSDSSAACAMLKILNDIEI